MNTTHRSQKVKVNFLILKTTSDVLRALAEQDHRHPGQMVDWLIEQETVRREAKEGLSNQSNVNENYSNQP